MTAITTVPFVRAAGPPSDVGYAHGAARAGALRAFLDDDLARINRIRAAPVTLVGLRPELAAYGAAIAAAAPGLSEEIDGLARGAGLTREEAVLLQARREIIGYQRVTGGDCTTYASRTAGPDGDPVLAQTVDLNGNLDDQITVLHVDPGTGRQSLVLSFGGLLGYLGLNSDGLAIGLNLVLGGRWRPGLPPYLAIRHLLDHADSVAGALALLAGLDLASSRSLTLCDPTRIACVEVVDNQIRVLTAEPSVHTNHLLDPGLTGADELNVFARNSSVLRRETAQAALAELGDGASVEEHFGLLTRPPVCVADTGDIRRERTVAAVVMRPGRGELYLRPGDPRAHPTRRFALGEARP